MTSTEAIEAGYRIDPADDKKDAWNVRNPAGEGYSVLLSELLCSCPNSTFEMGGSYEVDGRRMCKHIIWAKEILNSGPVNERKAKPMADIVKGTSQALIAIAQQNNLPVEQVHQFVVLFDGKPYFTAPGLQYAMNRLYGLGNYTARSELPTDAEHEMIRKMWGKKDDEPVFIMKGVVEVKGQDSPFVAWGTAKPSTMKMKSLTFDDRALEMASTRAVRRAMCLATATGFMPAEEMSEVNSDPEPANTRTGEIQSPSGVEPGQGQMADAQARAIVSMIDENPQAFSGKEKEDARAWAKGNRTAKAASNFLDKLIVKAEEYDARGAIS